MKLCYCILLLLLACTGLRGQTSLLAELSTDSTAKQPVQATFKGTRVVNGHSVETKHAHELEFIIGHRFGRLNSGSYNLFGLDQAFIRLGLEYGITNRLGVGIGRSTYDKIYDGYVKYKLLQQRPGGMPITATLLGSVNIETVTTTESDSTIVFNDRLAYTVQALLAHKFSSRLSLQLMPTFTHINRVNKDLALNDVFSMGFAGRYRIAKRVAINAEYYYRAQRKAGSPFYDAIGLGIDIETGGHVFQLLFTNSQGMVERTFLTESAGNFFRGGIHYGFNITRTFNLKPRR